MQIKKLTFAANRLRIDFRCWPMALAGTPRRYVWSER